MRPVYGMILAALVAAAPMGAWAETRARAGQHDARVTYATYQSGQVYMVTTRLTNVTLIELGDGEQIRSIAIGDSASFQIDKLEGSNVFTVKPVVQGASTNLTVETDRRFYFLNVVETGRATPTWSIKFTVPGSHTPKSASSIMPAGVPMTYKILKRSTGTEFAPISAWDDGRKTYFRIPPDAPIPAVFRADDRGLEYSVNSTASGTLITIAARSERWVLRHGEDYVCIEGQQGGIDG
jgi:type IV secretion system protein VirB9